MTDDIEMAGVGKEVIRSALERPPAVYHCPFCDRRADTAGRCPDDGIPLRKLPKSKT